MRTLQQILISLSICLGLGLPGVAFAGSSFYDFSLLSSYDTNVPRAERSVDKEEDFVVSASASGHYRQRLNETTGIQVGARLGADGHKRFGGLNRVSAGFETNLHFKPVPGYSKPWYRLHANIELSKFADSDLRDGLAGALVADVGLRLAPGLIGKAGYNFDWRRAFDGNVFDTSGHSLFASADYTLTSKVHLYSRYQARVGTVVSTASPSARLLANANAIEIDNTFGRSTNANFIGPPGQVGARPAYQLDAFSQSVRAGFNVALTHAMSLDLSAQWLTVDGRGGIDYRAWDFGGAILYRFR